MGTVLSRPLLLLSSVLIVLLAGLALPQTASLWLLLLSKPKFVWGVIAAVLLYWSWRGLRQRLVFLSTLDHELSHVLMTLMCGQRPTSLQVHAFGGGSMGYQGAHRFGELLISLSPYVLRTPAVVLTLISPIIPNGAGYQWFLFWYGLACTYSVWAIVQEARPHQTDLQYAGVVLSYVWIVALQVLGWGIALSIVLHSQTVFGFLRAMWRELWSWV